jgi:hypothetical protein
VVAHSNFSFVASHAFQVATKSFSVMAVPSPHTAFGFSENVITVFGLVSIFGSAVSQFLSNVAVPSASKLKKRGVSGSRTWV